MDFEYVKGNAKTQATLACVALAAQFVVELAIRLEAAELELGVIKSDHTKMNIQDSYLKNYADINDVMYAAFDKVFPGTPESEDTLSDPFARYLAKNAESLALQMIYGAYA